MKFDFRILLFIFSTFLVVSCAGALVILARIAAVVTRPRPRPQSQSGAASSAASSAQANATHLLVVLGSGGHTAEMLNMLSALPDIMQEFTHRTYLVSSGDDFSARKAKEFEDKNEFGVDASHQYDIVMVRRARKVHQSFLTTPWSALLSLWDCLRILQGRHTGNTGVNRQPQRRPRPDLILTNGPGTGVCVVVASIILLLFSGGFGEYTPQRQQQGQMRTVFVESWARVKTLSLSGKILRSLVNRFLVQWPQLAGEGLEYVGPLVS